MNTRMFRVRPFQPPGWRSTVRLLAAAVLCACLAPAQPATMAASPEQPPTLPQVNGTQYLSIPAAAFHPKTYYYYDYINYGSVLVHQGHTYGAPGIYYAPLHLPHLATITKVNFFYEDTGVDDSHALKLVRTVLTEGSIPTINVIADLHAEAGIGWDEAVLSHLVDNGLYGYFFEYTADITGTDFYRVLVEYTLPGGTPVPERLGIPPAAFLPFAEGLWIENSGNFIKNYDTAATIDIQAPVMLPHGATALDTKFYFYDADAGMNIEAHLHRTDLKGSWDPSLAMADLASSAAPDYAADAEPVARYEMIDNSNYAYWVYYRLPPRTGASVTVQGRDLTISYQRDSPFPIQSISVPAAAFTPEQDGQSYENHGRYLKSFVDGQAFVAPLYLPHGKYIRSVRFYYERIGPPAYETRAYLSGTLSLASGLNPNIYLQSSEAIGWAYTDSGQLAGLQVDNLHRWYWLEWEVMTHYMAGNYVLPSGMVVEVSDYNTLLFLPMVSK